MVRKYFSLLSGVSATPSSIPSAYPLMAVNGVFKSNGRGAFGEAPIKTNMEKQNWWNKLSKTNKAILGITGALAILGGGYYLYKNSNKKLLGLPEKNPVAKTEIIKDNSAKIKQKEVKHLSAIV